MWPFPRKVDAPAAAAGPRPVPAPVIRRDWAGLPPIQRFVGAHPLTAPSDQFSDDLATHQDPSVTTDTMGHQVSADAPAGLVLALARPTTRSDGPAMIPRPRVQRNVAGAVTESGEWDGDEAAAKTARPVPLPINAHPVAERVLPVVAPAPPIQRLTSLGPEAEPTPLAPVAQRSKGVPSPLIMASAGDELSETMTMPAPRLTLGQSRRLGLGAPIKQVPEHSLQRRSTELPLAALSQNAREAVDLPMPTSEMPELSAGTRDRIDAARVDRGPVDLPGRLPASWPSVQRTPHAQEVQRPPLDLPVMLEPATEIQSPVADTSPAAFGAPLLPSLEADGGPRLDLPLAHRSPADAPSTVPAEKAAPSAPPLNFGEAASVGAPSVGAASDAPAPTSPTIQRAPQDLWPTAPSSASRRGFSPPDGSAPSLQRAAASTFPLAPQSPPQASGLPAAPARTTATAPLAGALPLRPSASVQRASFTEATALSENSAPTLTLPHRGKENQASLVQTTMDDAPTPAFLQSARAAQGWSEPSATPAITQSARENSRLLLAPSRGIAVQRAAQPADDASAAPIEAGDEAPTAQGVWYESGVGVSRVSGEAPSSNSGASVAAPAGPHQASETEMDELARKLYDRIRSRLKTELLVDRERAGFLTDLR